MVSDAGCRYQMGKLVASQIWLILNALLAVFRRRSYTVDYVKEVKFMYRTAKRTDCRYFDLSARECTRLAAAVVVILGEKILAALRLRL